MLLLNTAPKNLYGYTVSKPISKVLNSTTLQANNSKACEGFSVTLPNTTSHYPTTFQGKVVDNTEKVVDRKTKALPLQTNGSKGCSGVVARTPDIGGKKDNNWRHR